MDFSRSVSVGPLSGRFNPAGVRPTIFIAAILTAFFSATAFAANPPVPEEYESTGGHSLAFGGSVASGMGGASAIRSNPALLSLEKEYSVNGAYHWPTAGRDFYQLGVVDGKTSSVAAGFAYTGAQENYQGITGDGSQGSYGDDKTTLDISKDTPMVRRAALAFAMPIGNVYAGVGGGYIEARPPEETLVEDGATKIKGFTMGFGLAAHLSPAIRVGLSAENLANRKVQYAAPTFYRAAASYFMGDAASFHLDYRRREAVPVYEGRTPSIALADDAPQESNTLSAENLVNASTSIKIYDLLRVVAALGQVKSDEMSATRLAGGLSLVNQKFNFSYQALRPDVSQESVHHALSLGLDVAM